MPRKILHMDLDAFFCAVEENKDPSLHGKPFIVGGNPGERGVVASASYPARQFGIHSAMPTSQAVRLCPQLIIVHGRHHAYSTASSQVMDRLANLSPLIEQVSIDEAFLDVSDLPQSGFEIARGLQDCSQPPYNQGGSAVRVRCPRGPLSGQGSASEHQMQALARRHPVRCRRLDGDR